MVGALGISDVLAVLTWPWGGVATWSAERRASLPSEWHAVGKARLGPGGKGCIG